MEQLNTVTSIINPEIPESVEEKRLLLERCRAAIALGGTVEGVTPHHVTQDGAVILGRMTRSPYIQQSGL